MKEQLNRILKETESEIQELQEKVNQVERDPMIIVNEILAKNDLFLPILIQRYGDQALLDMQSYWYDMLFPALKIYLGLDDIVLTYDETIYPAPIRFYWKEEFIGSVDIVHHQFERTEPEFIIMSRERLAEVEQELQEIMNELNEKEPMYENPFIIGGANVVKLLDISLRRGKYKKEVLAELKNLNEELLQLEQERLRLRTTIDYGKQQTVEREYRLDRIEDRIMKLPGYTILKKGWEEPETFSFELNEPLMEEGGEEIE